MHPNNHHALIIGASSLTGWSLITQLLHPTHATPFTKITALTNRPLEPSNTCWPAEAAGRAKLVLISGVDLRCSDAEFKKSVGDKVGEDVQTISHIFYFAFQDHRDAHQEAQLNVSMMRRVVHYIKTASSHLQFFVYLGGTRGYGIYAPGGIFSAPLVESMADALPEEDSKTVAYPHYRSLLAEESEGQKWTWCELCPDAIIGFTPNGSGYSLAGHWAVYLCAWKLVYGEGAEVPFPGTVRGYDALYTETSASTLASVAIYASLHPSKFREKIVNVADSAMPGSMRDRWPQIAGWFGLKGVPPPATASAADPKPGDFIRENREKLKEAGVKRVDIWNSQQLDSYGYWLTFDRHLSLKRLREGGFEEEKRPQDGWWEAFDMFKKAGMIR